MPVDTVTYIGYWCSMRSAVTAAYPMSSHTPFTSNTRVSYILQPYTSNCRFSNVFRIHAPLEWMMFLVYSLWLCSVPGNVKALWNYDAIYGTIPKRAPSLTHGMCVLGMRYISFTVITFLECAGQKLHVTSDEQAAFLSSICRHITAGPKRLDNESKRSTK